MPRRISPEQAELRVKLAELKARRAAQADAERPLREARKALAQSLSGHLSRVRRHADKVIKAHARDSYSNGLYRWNAERHEADLSAAEKRFRTALVALQLFDVQHNVVGAEYPSLPHIDREGIRQRARAEHEADMRAFRTGERRPTPT
jgi:hypothetical protein